MNIAIADLKPSLFVGKIEDVQDGWTLFHYIRANIKGTCPKCKEEVPLKELDGIQCTFCRPCAICGKADTEKGYKTWGIYGSYAGYVCVDCAESLLTTEQKRQKSKEDLC